PMGGTDPKFVVMMIFTIWSGFGTAVLIYTSTMSGIPTEVVESAKLDGITPFKELIFITMPMIYPTFVTFMLVNFAALFTNEMSMFLMFNYDTSRSRGDSTIGYFLFARAYMANHDGIQGLSEMSYLSAFGILLSIIAIPLTFLVKRLLEKFGPSFE
ncbi:MAG: sugar ABC transporter permease, partial [Clostridia bacterium]|nr:sugar ABC transporter permease [Clostridia bacterium]